MKIKFDCGGFLATGLLILFIGLKLLGIIDWAWIWVLSPLWIPIILVIVVVTVIVAVAFVIDRL